MAHALQDLPSGVIIHKQSSARVLPLATGCELLSSVSHLYQDYKNKSSTRTAKCGAQLGRLKSNAFQCALTYLQLKCFALK